jgi:hypothetical protein
MIFFKNCNIPEILDEILEDPEQHVRSESGDFRPLYDDNHGKYLELSFAFFCQILTGKNIILLMIPQILLIQDSATS